MSDILEALMSRSMNDIADLPTYSAPPEGTYRLKITKSEGGTIDIDEKRKNVPSWQMEYCILEVLELADETKREEVKEGTHIFQQSYMFMEDHEKTLGAMKAAFSNLAVEMNCDDMSQLVKQLKDMEVVGIVEVRKNKQGRTFAHVKNLQLAK